MIEFQSWAGDFALILIVTGIFMKFVSPQSEKNTIRFVATLIIIMCVLRLNTKMFKTSFSLEAESQVFEKEENLNAEMRSILSDKAKEIIYSEIESAVFQYDKNANVKSTVSSDAISVSVSSEKIDEVREDEIRKILEEKFGCKISLKIEKG